MVKAEPPGGSVPQGNHVRYGENAHPAPSPSSVCILFFPQQHGYSLNLQILDGQATAAKCARELGNQSKMPFFSRFQQREHFACRISPQFSELGESPLVRRLQAMEFLAEVVYA